MKTIKQARAKIDGLKYLKRSIPIHDKEGLDDINKLIKKEYDFIYKKKQEIQQAFIDVADKTIKECIDMFKGFNYNPFNAEDELQKLILDIEAIIEVSGGKESCGKEFYNITVDLNIAEKGDIERILKFEEKADNVTLKFIR